MGVSDPDDQIYYPFVFSALRSLSVWQGSTMMTVLNDNDALYSKGATCLKAFERQGMTFGFFLLVALAWLGVPAAPAVAGTVTACTDKQTALVQVDPDASVAGCLSAADFPSGDSPDALNSVNAFGSNTWSLLAKDNDLDGTDEGPLQAALSIDGDTKEGKLTIDNTLLGGLTQVVLSVSKGTNEAFWYLINLATGSNTTGVYMTGFMNKNGNYQDISHVSLLAPSVVPIPAALPLFASGLAGMVLLQWRRRRKGQSLATLGV
jgi:hypothetical protein